MCLILGMLLWSPRLPLFPHWSKQYLKQGFLLIKYLSRLSSAHIITEIVFIEWEFKTLWALDLIDMYGYSKNSLSVKSMAKSCLFSCCIYLQRKLTNQDSFFRSGESRAHGAKTSFPTKTTSSPGLWLQYTLREVSTMSNLLAMRAAIRPFHFPF